MLQISREVLSDVTWLATADEVINSPLIKKELSLRVKETQPVEETWQYLNKERKPEIFYFVLNCSNLREI